jgi:hypothetical protein
VFVSVKFCDFVCPSTTLPKAKLAGAMLNPGCTPVPVKKIVSGECSRSVVIVTVPDALPAAVGANTALSVAVAAGFNIRGAVIPFTLKPDPLTAMLEIWMAAVPVLLKTMGFVELLPMLTLPKLTDVGFACNCPDAAVEPVPANVTVIVGLAESLLVMESVPLAAPATVGRKVKPAETAWPAVIVFGVVIPFTPNAAPVTEITEIVRSAFPVFDIKRFAFPVAPTLTVPN